eukprot:8700678-Alexandrium_andersonii.AAC.1
MHVLSCKAPGRCHGTCSLGPRLLVKPARTPGRHARAPEAETTCELFQAPGASDVLTSEVSTIPGAASFVGRCRSSPNN